MAKKKKHILSIRVTDREQIWGFVYLLVSLFVLPSLLKWGNGLLPFPISSTWLNFFYFLLNFLFILWIFHGFFKRSLQHIGTHVLLFLGVAISGFAAYWLSSWGISSLLRLLFADYANLNDMSILSMAHENFLISFLGTVFLVPLAEEALHRGLIFGSLYPKHHAMAYILSTVIFASVHIMGYVGSYSVLHLALAFLQYIPAGLVLCWAYRQSGSIFAPILIHTTINAIAMFSLR